MATRIESALEKVSASLAGIDPKSVSATCQMLEDANKIGIFGCGREGYQLRGFAMRLFHLGCNVGFVGDTTMPPLGSGDVIVVSSGPGALATVKAHLDTAKAAGARTVLITAQPNPPEAGYADLVLRIPAQTMATDAHTSENDMLPMGSVYEAALFFLCEWLIADVKALSNETAQSIRARHTNME